MLYFRRNMDMNVVRLAVSLASTEVGKKGSHIVHVPEDRQRTGREVEEKDREDRRR